MAHARGEGFHAGSMLPEVDRRTLLRTAVVVAAAPFVSQLAGGSSAAAAVTELPVVSGGVALADVVVAPGADAQAQHAVDVLVEYIERATGVILPVTATEVQDGRTKLYVGRLPTGSDLPGGTLEGLPDDGFVIHPQDSTLAMIGPSSWGTRYAVYEFLERYLDVRWLMPDAWPGFPNLVGSDVPETSDLAVAVPQTAVEQPTFAERVVHPFPIPRARGQAWDYDYAVEAPNTPLLPAMALSWGRPNRGRHQIEFQHNLWALLPPEKYGDPEIPETYHPEFYPIIDGVRFIPPPGVGAGWNPSFTAEGIAEVVAAEAIAQADSTGLTSVSLAVNDAAGYSEDEVDTGVVNHFGLPSVSVHYYAFVTEVAQIIAMERPGLKIGLLAFSLVADPPAQPLPDNVVPFLTRETYSWLDPVHWARDDVWLQDWKAVSEQVGWWDYAYGPPYPPPRLYLSHMATVYQYLRDKGVIGVMAETRIPLGEGPKMWIMSKLLWDPDQDVQGLLNEWCTRAVGASAAPDLASYFSHWDDFWTTRVPGTDWFNSSEHVFNAFRNATYLELVTAADIAQSRAWLESSLNLAGTPEQQERMAALFAHWEYFEASALSFPRRTTPPASATGALSLLTDTTGALDASIGYAATRLTMAEQLQEGLFDHGPVRHGLVWDGWNLYALWDVAQYIKDNEPIETGSPVRDKAEELLQAVSTNVQQFAHMTLAIANGNTTTAGKNMSFEDLTLASWNTNAHPRVLEIVPSTEHAADGAQSMFVPGNSDGPISQVVDAKPGFFRYSVKLFAPDGLQDTEQNPAPRPPYGYNVKLQVRVLDANSANIQQFSREFSIKPAAGSWHEIVLTDILVEGADRAVCWIIPQNDPPIWVDDVSVVQIGSESLYPDDGLWDLVDYLRANEPNGGPVTDDLENEGSDVALVVLGIVGGTLPSLTTNSSFEEGSGEDVPGWSMWIQNRPTGTIVHSTAEAHTGAASLAADSLTGGAPQATFPVSPGLIATEAHVLAQPAGTWNGEAEIMVSVQDSAGNPLQTMIEPRVPLASGNGVWLSVRSVGRIVDEPAVAQVLYGLRLWNTLDDPTVYVDDITVFQTPTA